MRLCFLNADREWSGRARAFADAAHVLRARGHETTLVCAAEGDLSRRFESSATEVLAVRTDGAWPRAGWQLRAVLRRKFVDVTFVHAERELLVAAAAVRFAGQGAVVQRVPPLAQSTLGRDARFGRRLVTAGTLFSLDQDARAPTTVMRASDFVVAPPGVAESPAISGDAEEAGSAVIGVVYDAVHRSRLSVVLGALALLAQRHAELRFRLLGPGDSTDALRMQAAALRIGSVVEMVDTTIGSVAPGARVARAELALVLADGDDAAFGILDCLSSGVPVITERTALSHTLMAGGESGVLTTDLDVAGYAALIAGLLADHGRRGQRAAAARAAAGRWTLTAMADGFERSARDAHDRSRHRV